MTRRKREEGDPGRFEETDRRLRRLFSRLRRRPLPPRIRDFEALAAGWEAEPPPALREPLRALRRRTPPADLERRCLEPLFARRRTLAPPSLHLAAAALLVALSALLFSERMRPAPRGSRIPGVTFVYRVARSDGAIVRAHPARDHARSAYPREGGR